MTARCNEYQKRRQRLPDTASDVPETRVWEVVISTVDASSTNEGYYEEIRSHKEQRLLKIPAPDSINLNRVGTSRLLAIRDQKY